MGPDQAVELLTRLLWSSAVVAGPVLLVALGVGLLVSVFQVATQLQEMTLGYIPKLAAAGLAIAALGPWMVDRITNFALQMFALIPAIAQA
jgi:flagellar biosynthesis protein FliQ